MKRFGIICLLSAVAFFLLLYGRCYWMGPSAPILRYYGFVLRGLTWSGTMYRARLDPEEAVSLRQRVEKEGWQSIPSCDAFSGPVTTEFDFRPEKGDYYAWKHFDQAELTSHLIIRPDGTALFHEFDTN